jgi:hypothetical protein
MIGALVALTLAGGLGQVGNLGQAFSGPRLLAPIAPTASSDARAQASSPLLLAQAGGGTVASGTTAHRSGNGAGTPARRPSHAGQVPSGGPFRRAPGSSGGGGRAPGSPTGGGFGSQPQQPVEPPPSTGPTPPPTLLSRVTGAAASVTRRIPGPAGAAATQAVETVGAAAAQVAPLNVPAPVQAPAQTIAPVATLGLAS